jgi:hypothetical protein
MLPETQTVMLRGYGRKKSLQEPENGMTWFGASTTTTTSSHLGKIGRFEKVQAICSYAI